MNRFFDKLSRRQQACCRLAGIITPERLDAKDGEAAHVTLLDYRDIGIGQTIENIVYFELLRRGYDVLIGKVDNKGVDFIATNTSEDL